MKWSLLIGLNLYVAFFGCFIYICLIADPETSRLAQFFVHRVPNYFYHNVMIRFLGHKRSHQISHASQRAMQGLYLIVFFGSYFIIFVYAYPYARQSRYVPKYHLVLGYLVFCVAFGSWIKACLSHAGSITRSNLAKYDHYPCDGWLFPSDRYCPTTGIRKLARSKYDRFTDHHVPRFDHFCGWIHVAVGEENYRWFLLFLGIQALVVLYGSFAMWLVLRAETLEKDLMNATFFNTSTGQETKATLFVVFQYLLYRRFEIMANLFFLIVMSCVLVPFFGYHLWLTAFGMTTNEHFKWKQIRKWHKQETKRYKQAIKDGTIITLSNQQEQKKKKNDHVAGSDNVDVGCTGAVPSTTNDTNQEEEEEWKEGCIMDPGPFPKNIYNRGIVENFMEVIFPRSLRKDALERYEASLRQQQEQSSSTTSSSNGNDNTQDGVDSSNSTMTMKSKSN